jgi:hypothetical protein
MVWRLMTGEVSFANRGGAGKTIIAVGILLKRFANGLAN